MLGAWLSGEFLSSLQNASGNAAKAGIKPGDTIIYSSSFFGDELWPADKLGFTRSALANAPSPVTVVYVSSSCDAAHALVRALHGRGWLSQTVHAQAAFG